MFGGNGLRGYTDRYNHDGDFALIGRQGALCGNMNFSSGKAYFTEHAVAVKADKSNDTRFLFYCFGTMNLGQYSGQSAQPGLAVGNLVELETMVPTKAEQECISASLTALDTLITLHQREESCAASFSASCFGTLKAFFWEQRKFYDVFSILQNCTLSRAELSYDNGEAFNIHYGDVLIKFGEVIDAETALLPRITDDKMVASFRSSALQDGDIVIADTAEDEAVGKCAEMLNLQEKTAISGLHTIPARPTVRFATGYLGYFMNSPAYHDQLLPLMQGTKVTSVSKSALQDTVISFPSERAEQGQIGRYFMDLDTLITLHQCKPKSRKGGSHVLYSYQV